MMKDNTWYAIIAFIPKGTVDILIEAMVPESGANYREGIMCFWASFTGQHCRTFQGL
jgi:hypothetical protein